MKDFLYPFFALVVAMLAMTACSDDSEPAIDDSEEGEQVIGIDELADFSSSFVSRAYDNNSEIYIRGAVLDNAYPNVLSIAVENKEEAEDIFRTALPAEPVKTVIERGDGSIVFCPTDTLGKAQGTITFVPQDGKFPYAKVNFSDGAKIGNIDTIEFIDLAEWPNNDTHVSKYSAGEYVPAVPGYEYSEGGLGLNFVRYCIKASTATEAGIIVSIDADIYFELRSNFSIKRYFVPTRAEMAQVSQIMRKDWALYKELYNDNSNVNVNLQDDTEFWIAEVKDKFLWKESYAMCLKTGAVTCYKWSFSSPVRRSLIIMYFN